MLIVTDVCLELIYVARGYQFSDLTKMCPFMLVNLLVEFPGLKNWFRGTTGIKVIFLGLEKVLILILYVLLNKKMY